MSALMVDALLHGTVLFALTWVATKTVLREPRVGALLWAIVLAKFIVPFAPALPFSLSHWVSLTLPTQTITAQIPAAGGQRHSEWALTALYGLVVAVLALRKARAYASFSRRVRRAPLADAATIELVDVLSLRMGLQRAPQVRIDPALGGPLTFGLLAPSIVMPSVDGLSAADLESIVLHELSHLRRHDGWVRLLQWVCEVVFFFWPPVHVASARLDEARELACDALALRHSCLSGVAYARCLVSVFRNQHAPFTEGTALAMASHPSHLERRIDMLLKMKRNVVSKRFLGAAVVLWGALALAGVRSGSASEEADKPAIRAVIHEHRGEIRSCYEAMLARNVEAQGDILVQFDIGRSGAVKQASIDPIHTTLTDATVQNCITGAITKWQFEASTGEVHVTYPFKFSLSPN